MVNNKTTNLIENNNDDFMTDKEIKKRIKYYFSVNRILGNRHIYESFYSQNTGLNKDWDSIVWYGIHNFDEDYADRMVEIIRLNIDLQNNINNNFTKAFKT